MPTDAFIRGSRHSSDDDFLSLEDIVFGFTHYLSDDTDGDDEEDQQHTQNKNLSCPVCKTPHDFVPPTPSTPSSGVAEQYSHNARVIYASFACPICLDDEAGPPMVVLPCGHAICQDDFRLLGGTTGNASEDAQVRQAAAQETAQQQQQQSRQQQQRTGRSVPSDEEFEYMSSALMHAFAHHLMHDEAQEEEDFRRAVGLSINTDSDYDEDDSDDDTYSDGSLSTCAEFRRQLELYHCNNVVPYNPPQAGGFPKIGQWMLVPNVDDPDLLNLVYYCDHPDQKEEDESPIYLVIPMMDRGAKLIPNGPYGVYIFEAVYESPFCTMSYVKNIPPHGSPREPVPKFMIPKNSECVVDGAGGIYALCPTRGRSNNRNNHHRSERNNHHRSECQLLRFSSRRHPEGQVFLDKTVPASSKIFMDRTGGVILFTPEELDFSSLWHLSQPNERLLLYRGIPKQARVIGNTTHGSSVLILSPGGRLQSILTRVSVERDAETGTYASSTTFSYDLDIPMEGIKDIVQDPSDPKRVFVHTARQDDSRGGKTWKVCLLSPEGEITELYACAKRSRMLSDHDQGVWVWKKPNNANCAQDRSFVHINGQGRSWASPRVFPPSTLLAALPFH